MKDQRTDRIESSYFFRWLKGGVIWGSLLFSKAAFSLAFHPASIRCNSIQLALLGAARSDVSAGSGVWANPAVRRQASGGAASLAADMVTQVWKAELGELSSIYEKSRSVSSPISVRRFSGNIQAEVGKFSLALGACRDSNTDLAWNFLVDSPETKDFNSYRWVGKDLEVFEGIGSSLSYQLSKSTSLGVNLHSVSIFSEEWSGQYIEYGLRSFYSRFEHRESVIAGQKVGVGISYWPSDTFGFTAGVSHYRLFSARVRQSTSELDTTDFFQGVINGSEEDVTVASKLKDSLISVASSIEFRPWDSLVGYFAAQVQSVDTWADSDSGVSDPAWSTGIQAKILGLGIFLAYAKVPDLRGKGFSINVARKRFVDTATKSAAMSFPSINGYNLGFSYQESSKVGRARFVADPSDTQALELNSRSVSISLAR